MTRGLFITGTDTAVGKTMITTALTALLRAAQLDVGVMKPVETGRRSREVSDATRLVRAAAPTGADPYVAKMVISLEGGKTVEWLIRRSELPEDLRQMRERDIEAFISALRQRGPSASRP